MNFELINGATRFDAVVLAAGDFPTNEIPLAILRHGAPLIVCDSAMEGVVEFNRTHSEAITPAAIVGDGDSLPHELKELFADIYHQYSEQEYNDLTKATRFAIANYAPKTIAYVGATGKREDHTLGNVSLMAYYLKELGVQPFLITDYGWFTPASGANSFATFPRQQVSIFNVDCHELTGTNLRWNPYPFRQLWEGTLNEPTGNQFSLSADGTYIVFQTFEPKTVNS